jgi:hypothetical protein
LLVAAGAEAADVKLESVRSACGTVKRFERCELTVKISGRIANPYDPDEVALEATFTPAKGKAVTVPGFHLQPYERISDGGRELIRPSGGPEWRVRFTPRTIGRWSYTVKLVTPKGAQSVPGEPFLVVESPSRGFVLFNPEQGNFRFERGEPFIPIGENLGWGPSAQPLSAYERWFRDLARVRANYIRVWLAPWGFRLETKDTGVGRYDQLRAWYLDQLFDRSAAEGLYWQLCLLNHGAFSRSQDPDWHNNPYNETLGGMCRAPNEFLTDPRARAMFRRLLRYLVARWGDSPQLVMWELFNEADFGEFNGPDLVAWTQEMAAYLQTADVNHRAVTTSFHKHPPEGVWALPTMSVVQLHVYDERDFLAAFQGPKVAEAKAAYKKPVFIGEFGWINDIMRKFDDIGIHLHEGLWASLMAGTTGSALVWYWDVYVHPNGLERHFRAVEAFWKGEQLARNLPPVKLSLSSAELDGIGIGRPNRLYLWIRNRAHSLDQYVAYRCEAAKRRLRQERGEAVEPIRYAPPPVRGATATIEGLGWLGRYRIEWWDTYRGRIAARTVGQSQWGRLTVQVPDVGFDVAAKVIKLQWWERG